MPTELLALILIAALLIGAVAGMTVEQSLMRRRAWLSRNGTRTEDKRSSGFWHARRDYSKKPFDAADQLRIVMDADFTIQPLLNKSEARVFKELDRIVIARNPTWQVMAQVSLGEILQSTDRDAYLCINSKRVDLLLVDGDCRPRYAIEYQGHAHHQGTAAARDAVKKEALRRAGIGYYEVLAGQTKPADLRRLVNELVDCPVPTNPPLAPAMAKMH